MKNALIRNVRWVATSPVGSLLIGSCTKPSMNHLRDFRSFHSSTRREAVIPYMLADIGEGITECQIIEWFVEPGTRVEQFDRICEVQSDKASVEITSRFDGVIKALHYEKDAMAAVGKPLVDIDVDGEVAAEEASTPIAEEAKDVKLATEDIQNSIGTEESESFDVKAIGSVSSLPPVPQSQWNETGRGVTTPGVRHRLKELGIDITDVVGTGKNGRVRKEDIERYSSSRSTSTPVISTPPTPLKPSAEDKLVSFSPTDNQMFKVMTKSLEIPQFLYTHSVDVTSLNNLRQRFNSSSQTGIFTPDGSAAKLSPLPFIMKAVSQVMTQFPKVNAHLDTSGSKPQLLLKASHNFGLAIDTPNGLVVPVIRDVQNHSIITLAVEISRISSLAQKGKLSVADFKGATLSISNIGSIGGGVVSPIIVSPMVTIIGVGRAKTVPVFEDDGKGGERIGKREEVVLSWSADHRVLDGATVARCAESVGAVLENMEIMGVTLR